MVNRPGRPVKAAVAMAWLAASCTQRSATSDASTQGRLVRPTADQPKTRARTYSVNHYDFDVPGSTRSSPPHRR